MQISFSPDEIGAIIKPLRIRGGTSEVVRGIAALATAEPGDLSFLGNRRYRPEVAQTRASVVLLPADYEGEPKPGQLFLLVDNPSLGLARICARIEQAMWPKPAPGVHPTAWVHPDASVAAGATVGPNCVVESRAQLGERCHLEANVFVGRGAQLGEDCWLMPGTTVATECVLGKRVRLQPGVVVGSDGFGYEFEAGHHEKVPQIGIAVLEDDVEIGANSTIDRARFGRTLIGEGTKIDNLVQVAHNVTIGRHCMICAQVGISGSTVLDDFVFLAGQVGVVGHIRMGRGSRAGAQSGISNDVPEGATVFGSPSQPIALAKRLVALSHRLPELFQRIKALEEALEVSPKS
jgi:UDP-3-O-[3-hydroxymyristoyl] glucosamine N-acyltransferase